ncbi:MAG: hypothetical protein KJO11_01205 [Gemmatimonadetes bacterium]|nr:hypothetical protein [Gemmatimonadota bacterium]
MIIFALGVPLAALEVILLHSVLTGDLAGGALQGVVILGIAVYALATRARGPSARRQLLARTAVLVSAVAMFATVLLYVRLTQAQGGGADTGAVFETAAFVTFQLGWAVTFWMSEVKGRSDQGRLVPAAIGTVLFIGGGVLMATGTASARLDLAAESDPGTVVYEMFATPEDWGSAVETARAGDDSGSSFAHFHTGGEPLLGLSFGTREWFGRVRIDGEIMGIFEGEPAPAAQHVLQGEPGYVVTAVEVQADDHVNAVRVQFALYDGVYASPFERYWSPWVGSHVRNGATTRLGGADAATVVGLRGSSGLVLNSLSLLTNGG